MNFSFSFFCFCTLDNVYPAIVVEDLGNYEIPGSDAPHMEWNDCCLIALLPTLSETSLPPPESDVRAGSLLRSALLGLRVCGEGTVPPLGQCRVFVRRAGLVFFLLEF